MSDSVSKPKKLTLTDDDITLSRVKAAPASLTNVGGGPGAAGKHVGGGAAGTDPDSSPPASKPQPQHHHGGDPDAS